MDGHASLRTTSVELAALGLSLILPSHGQLITKPLDVWVRGNAYESLMPSAITLFTLRELIVAPVVKRRWGAM